jgi:hypothetical protein
MGTRLGHVQVDEGAHDTFTISLDGPAQEIDPPLESNIAELTLAPSFSSFLPLYSIPKPANSPS